MTATYPTVKRVAGDHTSILFSWPALGATITLTRSINGGAFAAAAGAVAFVRTANGVHFYSIAHRGADRPSDAGSVLFQLTDGTTTRLLPLQVDAAVDCLDDSGSGDVTPLLTPDSIGEAMAGPASMTVEGNTMTQHSLPDQIAADRYRRNLIAAEQPTSKRLRMGRFVPPGTT